MIQPENKFQLRKRTIEVKRVYYTNRTKEHCKSHLSLSLPPSLPFSSFLLSLSLALSIYLSHSNSLFLFPVFPILSLTSQKCTHTHSLSATLSLSHTHTHECKKYKTFSQQRFLWYSLSNPLSKTDTHTQSTYKVWIPSLSLWYCLKYICMLSLKLTGFI